MRLGNYLATFVFLIIRLRIDLKYKIKQLKKFKSFEHLLLKNEQTYRYKYAHESCEICWEEIRII